MLRKTSFKWNLLAQDSPNAFVRQQNGTVESIAILDKRKMNCTYTERFRLSVPVRKKIWIRTPRSDTTIKQWSLEYILPQAQLNTWWKIFWAVSLAISHIFETTNYQMYPIKPSNRNWTTFRNHIILKKWLLKKVFPKYPKSNDIVESMKLSERKRLARHVFACCIALIA